jgi:hypothetical protein
MTIPNPDTLVLDTLRMAYVFVRDDNALQHDRTLLEGELVQAIAAEEAKQNDPEPFPDISKVMGATQQKDWWHLWVWLGACALCALGFFAGRL